VVVACLTAAALVAVAWPAMVQSPERKRLAVNTVGGVGPLRVRPAPDFTLPLFTGGTWRLATQRDGWVVVNFWASWCPPCREEAPELEAAWQSLRGRGVVLLGVNVWDSEDAARQFLQAFELSYPNGPDPQGRILIEFGVTGIPETYVVDEGGLLVGRWVGPIHRRQLEALLQDARERLRER
jgi:cytochrome c biogenesis protein CcmG/thiol:disulfide interchange protein DsbE